MKTVILVNGVPASGKSTVTDALVRLLTNAGIAAVPFALDTVKECLYAHVGAGDRDHNRMLGRASYHSIFASLTAFPDNLVPVIDAWHGFLPLETLKTHVADAGIGKVIEVWCQVSPAVAADRYRRRAPQRQVGHPPASYGEELYVLAGRAKPLAIGAMVRIDTERPVDDRQLAGVLRLLDDL